MKAYKSKNGILREIWGAQSLESKARCAMIVRLQIMKGGLQLFSMYAIVQKEEFSMKNGMKRLVSGLFAIAMVLTTFGVNTKTASAEKRTMQNYVYDGYEVDFNVTDAWDGAFNAEVKLANTGDAEICDWALTFEFAHEIQNLWNATVVEHTGNAYVIKNADWNANIKPGEGVTFGMTVLCDGEIAFPENFSFVMEEESVTAQSYSAEFIQYSDWGTGCNGAIILSNLTNKPIENWQLEFDYDREIVDIANAVIISHKQGHYVLKNAEYNADIAANSSVHVSIVAGEGAAEERPVNFNMQQTVVGDTSTETESEMDPVIAERLKGVKYKEPEAEHVQYDEATDTYYIDNQLLLITKAGVEFDEVSKLADEVGASIVGYIILTGDYQLEFNEGLSLEKLNEIVHDLMTRDVVDFAMLHDLCEMDICMIPNDAMWYDEESTQEEREDEWNSAVPYGKNWGLEAINVLGAWEYEGEPVNVGILDTMFDTSHEDLQQMVVALGNPDDVIDQYEKEINSKGEYNSKYGHGTHVAGIMSATINNGKGISGVAPNISLYASATHGFEIDKGTQREPVNRNPRMVVKYSLAYLILSDCRVINYSMGDSNDEKINGKLESDILADFLSVFIGEGYDFLIVQAAGNDSSDANNCGSFMAITDESIRDRVLVVGAVGLNSWNSTNLDDLSWMPEWLLNMICEVGERVHFGYHYCDFSNYGERVEICAPGERIYSTLPGNKYSDILRRKENGEIEYWSGTSQAAPYVTGVAAMCFAVNPKLTGAQVKRILIESAELDVYEERSGRFVPFLNAEKAVSAALTEVGEGEVVKKKAFGVVTGQVLKKINMGPQSSELLQPVWGGVVVAELVDGGDASVISTASDSFGAYEIILRGGMYNLYVTGNGCMTKKIENVWIEGNKAVLLDITLYPDSAEGEVNEVKGYIKDALTEGVGVPNATINVKEGGYWVGKIEDLVFEEGDIIQTVKTDQDGKYLLELPSGYYTIEIEKDGYITSYKEIVSVPYIGNQNMSISPTLKSDEYRIVLTWGERPWDLDSHLYVTKQGEELYHVSYWNMVHYEDGEIVAQLDIDDTWSEGPETITVTVVVDKELSYHYYVHDYTNGSNSSSTELSLSGASVQVYNGERLIKSYTVPMNEKGTRWNVFEIMNGKLVDINTIN